MFTDKGALFYPAYPGDPFWKDFITDEGLADDDVPQPSALAEFFGDHMVVNGKIWPKTDVEPRQYRLHLLNGTDSRFMLIRFKAVNLTDEDPDASGNQLVPFTVIGSDQGLAKDATLVTELLFEPGSRYDIIFDFTAFSAKRIIMENLGGDEPFGTGPGEFLFEFTDRIMAFDVVKGLGDDDPQNLQPDPVPFTGLTDYWQGNTDTVNGRNPRRVALFEGKDEFGRLQPLLGTAEPSEDYQGNPINWPTTPVYQQATLPDGTPSPLIGQMEGSIAWHSPTTENPAEDTTEIWDIWNVTGDAHPVHLHLVNFEVLGRKQIVWDSATNEEDRVLDPAGVTAPAPNGDGTYLVTQPTVQHNSVAGDPTTYGIAFKIVAHQTGADVPTPPEIVENAPKDMVTARPGEVTTIKATFDKPGRYVWHCHILSHEDHEMMRVLHVGPGA
jgi:FtsP/CotA-like multicopper oxidase with cupredoxin domain